MQRETTLTPWRPGLGMTAFDDEKNYIGAKVEGYFVYSKHRDSDTLGRSNFECILRDLTAKAEECGAPDCILDPSFNHWAVGYVDQIVLAPDAPNAVFEFAEQALERLAGYPVYDESHWSELEWNEAADYWDSQSPRDKVREAMNCRDRCHWLKGERVWIYGRMDYATLANHDSQIASDICESLRHA